MNQKFVSFVEKDGNGKVSSFVTMNTDYILTAVYDAFRNAMYLTVADPTFETRKFKQEFKDEQGKKKGGSFEGVGTFTQYRTMTIKDEQNIVDIYNGLNGGDHNGIAYSVANFPGFQLHRQYREEYEEALKKKEAEEAEAKQKQAEAKLSAIIDPNTDAPVTQEKKEGRGLIINPTTDQPFETDENVDGRV